MKVKYNLIYYSTYVSLNRNIVLWMTTIQAVYDCALGDIESNVLFPALALQILIHQISVTDTSIYL
jgi:hypothetical protein